MSQEFGVYQRLISFISKADWTIICACPPTGTDTRYRKCLLPRRQLGGSLKGPRDEVDLVAFYQDTILLIECKPKLSWSMTHVNNLLETDYEKLKRLRDSFSVDELRKRLIQNTGVTIPSIKSVYLALAVSSVDYAIPTDMTVILVSDLQEQVWSSDILYKITESE